MKKKEMKDEDEVNNNKRINVRTYIIDVIEICFIRVLFDWFFVVIYNKVKLILTRIKISIIKKLWSKLRNFLILYYLNT